MRLAVAVAITIAAACLPAVAAADPSPLVMDDLAARRAAGLAVLGGVGVERTNVIFQLHGAVPLRPWLAVTWRLPGGLEGLGNATVGAVVAQERTAAGHARLHVGALVSLSLPTAMGEPYRGARFLGGHDFGLAAPGTTTARAALAYRAGEESWFFQTAAGVNVYWLDEEARSWFPFVAPLDATTVSGTEAILCLSVAAGRRVGRRVALLAEVTAFSDVLQHRDDAGRDYVTALDVGVRWWSESSRLAVTPHLYAATLVRAVGGGVDVTMDF